MANYKSQYTGEQIDEGIGKANKALVTPDATPDGPRIVAINTDGTQQNLTLGDGLTVADGVISASGGGNVTPSNRIKFTINGLPYEADEGMTWDEWASSEYSNGLYDFAGAYQNILTSKYGFPLDNGGFNSLMYIYNGLTDNYAARNNAPFTNVELNIIANGIYSLRDIYIGSND